MTAADVFQAWVDLSFIPLAHRESMREAVKQADTLPPAFHALAFILLATEDKNLIWTTRYITEWQTLSDETIH